MDGFIASSATRLYYARLGPHSSDAPALVALHGGPGGSHDILLPGIAPLAEERRVILYDQRGCGRSEPLDENASCTLSDNVADLEALRRGLSLESMDLMGHSWGGLLALAYAVELEEAVRKLVLVTPALPYYPNPSWQEFTSHLSEEKRSEIAGIRRNAHRSEIAKRTAIWRITVKEFFHRKDILEEIDLDSMPYSPWVAARVAADLDGLDLRPRLARLRLPTLIVAGRFDPRLPPKHHEQLAELLPDSRLRVMEESGHFPFLEEKKQFAEVVEQFLAP